MHRSFFIKLSNFWSRRWETLKSISWLHKGMALKLWENIYRLANGISQWNINSRSWSAKCTLKIFQPGTWFLHLWKMTPPALDITLVCLSLDSEVRLPSIESSTLSPPKFSFPPKYWPVAVLLCLWDLTRLEASLTCLQAISASKQRSKCQKAAAEQELLPCCTDSFCSGRSH